jgi:hypothetical protein
MFAVKAGETLFHMCTAPTTADEADDNHNDLHHNIALRR